MKREFDVARAFYRDGGPVPEPLGVCWERHGLVYRGAIAYRRIAGHTLLHHLVDDVSVDRADTLNVAGASIRQMHDGGIWHADLQVKNILVSEEDVWLIDFDNARLGLPLGRIGRARNLLRLRRSFEKHGLPMDNFATLLAGYGAVELPAWLDWVYRLRGTLGRSRAV